ncbi:hypothetical protein cand_036420 [Cryptosporidium andersoni]|uniref:RNA polymerase III RPC4 family protein n=1 Tax=Cryptosporidium andersoni TaxID=117008 RepID=A0A1J4MVE8_9CRYT|nr:hypothetical protein cand_036420 [Cryptosporidium andersoni]
MKRLQSIKSSSSICEKFRTSRTDSGGSVKSLKFVPNVAAANKVPIEHLQAKLDTAKADKTSDKISDSCKDINISADNATKKINIYPKKIPRDVTSLLLKDLTIPKNNAEGFGVHKLTSNEKLISKVVDKDGPLEMPFDISSVICPNNENGISYPALYNKQLGTSENEPWLLIQVPKFMPSLTSFRDSNTTLGLDDNLGNPSFLADMQCGSIGKLTIKKSGKISLVMNKNNNSPNSEDVIFDIKKNNLASCEQNIIALTSINELSNLGKCATVFYATPQLNL